jgi:hypothetical protein
VQKIGIIGGVVGGGVTGLIVKNQLMTEGTEIIAKGADLAAKGGQTVVKGAELSANWSKCVNPALCGMAISAAASALL